MRNPRRTKAAPLATHLPYFQPGYDLVVRRGSRAFVVFGDGCTADQEVSGDFVDEAWRERCRTADPRILPLRRQQIMACGALSLEGRRERAAFIDTLIGPAPTFGVFASGSVPAEAGA